MQPYYPSSVVNTPIIYRMVFRIFAHRINCHHPVLMILKVEGDRRDNSYPEPSIFFPQTRPRDRILSFLGRRKALLPLFHDGRHGPFEVRWREVLQRWPLDLVTFGLHGCIICDLIKDPAGRLGHVCGGILTGGIGTHLTERFSVLVVAGVAGPESSVLPLHLGDTGAGESHSPQESSSSSASGGNSFATSSFVAAADLEPWREASK